MKNTKRRLPRRAARTSRQGAVEAKLLKICADVGWICGWREERIEPAPAPAPATRRSSRKRVMLGRVLAAEAKTQQSEAFRPIEGAFVSSERTAYVQAEPAAEGNGVADVAIELQEELVGLGRMGTSASALVGALGDAKGSSFGWQLWGQRRSAM